MSIVEDIQTGDRLETVIIESFDPVYDRATHSLTYTITATSIEMRREFGQSILVVDAINDISRAHYEGNTDLYKTPTSWIQL